MTTVFIGGVAGVLGSGLAKRFLDQGHIVVGMDIVRIEEAWRLDGYLDRPGFRYLWQSVADLRTSQLTGVDVAFDAGLYSADRPFGTESPETTIWGNLAPTLRLLECARRVEQYRRPVVVGISSFNSLYGGPVRDFVETSRVAPTTIYGFTKGAQELLHTTYGSAYGVPSVVVRVGSAFGPGGRPDELPHRLILRALRGLPFILRSPDACRLWSYSGDVLDFYEALLPRIHSHLGHVLHASGNLGDHIVTNRELAKMVADTVGSLEVSDGGYEPGEMVDGKPISFAADSTTTRTSVGWTPRVSLEDGLRMTADWFRANMHRYV